MNHSEQTDPAIIILFGITGDLSGRKLLPALYDLYLKKLIHPDSLIIGITRRDVSDDDMSATISESISAVVDEVDHTALAMLQRAVTMHRMDLSNIEDYQTLKKRLTELETKDGRCMDRIYYLSIPPQSYQEVINNLGMSGHGADCSHDEQSAGESRLLVEKPFGFDLDSAETLLKSTGDYFSDNQVFRIDHYAARPEMDDFVLFRTQPGISDIWNNQVVSDITITAFEAIGIEGRAVFYDKIGALRDFIQSHLLQVLALIAMPLPVDDGSDALHTARQHALEQLHQITDSAVDTTTVRGQYEGYLAEVDDMESHTETYASIEVSSSDLNWSGIGLTLRTGKAMDQKRTDIRFGLKTGGELIFTIQPDTGFQLRTSEHSDTTRVIEDAIAAVKAKRGEDSTERFEAYARVFLDALRGDQKIFTSRQEVLGAWRIVDNVVHAWAAQADGIITYPKGTSFINSA